MEINIEPQLKKICVGLDVYKARNRIQRLYPALTGRIDIEFVESAARRFIVVDCIYNKSRNFILLKATSNNPIRHLPSMYQENDFLRHFLMIFQHIMNETSITLDNMDNIFRPMETPAAFLPVLADWFGVDFSLLGTEETARKVLQYAIPLYKYRGTKRGLQALLYLVSGVMPEIVEGRLPFDAMCITNETDIDSPIFDIEERNALFSVYFPVFQKEMKDDMIKRLYGIIQNEKPAGTIGYLYFKKEEPKKRRTTVITKDMDVMGSDGIEF